MSGCITGKVQYESKKQAQGAARWSRAQTGHKNIKEFWCVFCNCWHNGHTNILNHKRRKEKYRQSEKQVFGY
jgi:hypothetical protein